ncbi:CYCD5-3 [Linum perenne]
MADHLFSAEDISEVTSTPADLLASTQPLPSDEDPFTEVSLKYSSTGGNEEEEEDEEFVRFLIEREPAHGYREVGGQSVDFDEWVRGVRTEAIDWILNKRTSLGLRWKTAHLSVSYFDRYLSKLPILPRELWVVRLLQISCLSLAAKMEESKKLSLVLNNVRDFSFEYITRMEIRVMNTLRQLVNSPTPFDYIPCFIVKTIEVCPSRVMISRIVKLIFALTKDVNLTNHRPSSIAIAAIMAGIDQKLEADALEGRLNAFAYAHLLDIGNVVECYNLMRNLDVDDRGQSSVIVSPDVSPGRFSDSRGGGVGSWVSSSNGKRRRLAFDRPPDL